MRIRSPRQRRRLPEIGVVAGLALLALIVAPLVGPALPAQAAPENAPEGFAVNCRFSHSDTVDPIVMPGHAGMSHLHEFFGNQSTDENSTGASLLASTGTCADGADLSAYWVPALLVNGVRVQPQLARVYYIGGGPMVTAFPAGFKAVSGYTDQTAAWGCVVPGEPPVLSSSVAVVPTCAGGAQLMTQITFPQCWDGRSLDSADHKSHLTFPAPAPGGRQLCPATHRVRVPQVRLIVIYPRSVAGGSSVTLASGPPSSLHGDIFEAWTGSTLQTRINEATPLGGRPQP